MTRTPEDLLRDELHRSLEPAADDVRAQAGRLHAAMHARVPGQAQDAPRRRRRIPRRRMLVVVGALASAALLAVALLPTSDDDTSSPDGAPDRLRLITAPAGGAFAGLKLESASAADVLDAAAATLASRTPETQRGDWSYRRTESRGNDMLETSIQTWTSPDGERQFIISATTVIDSDIGTPGRTVSIQYEYLREGTIGYVAWVPTSDGSTMRQATWSTDAGDGSDDIERVVLLRSRLPEARGAEDVASILDDAFSDPQLEFRGGSVCTPGGPCTGYGSLPSNPRMSADQSERFVKAGMLLTVLSSSVLPGESTRAAYEYLADLPEARTEPAQDESGDVLLSFAIDGPQLKTQRVPNLRGETGARYESRPVPGTTENVKAVALIDSSTGRIVQLDPEPEAGGISYRDVDAGFAPAPGVGGPLCDEFPDPCEELNDLAERLESDPSAQFEGVLDWDLISSICDGRTDRDGNFNPNYTPPADLNSAAHVERRDACMRREAARARRD